MSQDTWYLTIQRGPNAGSAYPLRGVTISIGRNPDNQIVIEDPMVSRYHARLTWQGNTFVLEDLGSANGTWVNDARITSPVLLRPGDSIGLGQNVRGSLDERSQASVMTQYGAGYPASPPAVAPGAYPTAHQAVAPAPTTSRVNWGWVVVGIGAMALVVALAVLGVALLMNGDGTPEAAVVAPTLAPTDTPVLTATPYPTYTPIPTEPPTYTPYPTYTPIPTYTPVPTEPPTYTPYPTYTPIPTQPPTYTPYPTYTPFPTQQPTRRPPQPTSRPTDTVAPTNPPPPPPYVIAINKVVLEPWGRPRNADGCNGPYNDKDPVRRLTVEIVLTNQSNRYVPDGWYPTFYTARGQVPPTCIWYYNNTAVQPGETTYVTFATHVDLDDWVQAMVLDELDYAVMVCFNAAGQVVNCP
jgi:hypothetical protein